MIDRNKLIDAAVSMFGAPYLFGAKWQLTEADPKGPVDCSGFTRWVYSRYPLEIPEGSTAQHADAAAVDAKFAMPGDLAFLRTPEDQNVEHHVGIVYDKNFMIEARGHLILDGVDIGRRVLLRPRKEWEARPDFLGYFRPKSVVALEGA